jgi:hypothetical protein
VKIPDPVDIDGVIQQMQADARVQFPQTQSPADRTLAEGIIKLADRLAKGDSSGVKAMLTPPAQGILDELVSTGGWTEGTKGIEQVRVVSVSGTTDERPESSQVAFAVQGKDGAYLLAWNGMRQGDSWVFQNAPCQGEVRRRASDFDGVSISSGISLASTQPEPAPEADAGRRTSGGSTGGGDTGSTPPAPEGSPSAPPTPIRKNTPAGPVNVPRGTPGGS